MRIYSAITDCTAGTRRGAARGPNSPGTESLWGRRISAGGAENPNSTTSTFFNTVNFLPKDLRFEHGGAKVASCPGRHLASLRPCCTGSIPETSFWLCKLPKSCVSYNFSIAFLFSLLLFLSKLPSSIINELVTKIYLHSSVTSPAFVIAEQFSRGKEWEQYYYYERIALLIPIDKRLGQSPARESCSSTKCKILFV